MSRFVDPIHTLETGMPGFAVAGAEGRRFEAAAKTATVLHHRESAPLYAGQAAFAFTGAEFRISIGTHVDSPSVARRAASMPLRAFAEVRAAEPAA